ncbi:DUF6053 domain-containing protein [Lysobacter enzymogenes]|uniref:DUF6053 domain-containing protein n=1 Tax=Lysobacter enzymogenes TaxID=69 RepID=UPI003D18874D
MRWTACWKSCAARSRPKASQRFVVAGPPLAGGPSGPMPSDRIAAPRAKTSGLKPLALPPRPS